LLTLGLPPDWNRLLAAFARGLGEYAERYLCPLLGGDTCGPGGRSACRSRLRHGAAGSMVKRTGVRPGDVIYVSGTIGDAALGLHLRLRADWSEALPETHRHFLRDATCCRSPAGAAPGAARPCQCRDDVSDGLVGDLTKMLRVSGVSAEIELARDRSRGLRLGPAVLPRCSTRADGRRRLRGCSCRLRRTSAGPW